MSINWNQERFSPRYLIPGSTLVAMIFISAINFEVPGLKYVFPQLGLMAIFYWGIYWPRLMPYWLVLIVGFLQDTLYGLPLGTMPLSYLLTLGTLVVFRRYFVNATFVALWCAFGVALFLHMLLIAGCLQYYYGTFAVPPTALWQWLLSVLVYPAAQAVLYWLHSTFLRVAA